MNSRTWQGNFRLTSVTGGIWRLDGASSHPPVSGTVQFVFTHVDANATATGARIDSIELTWREAGVRITLRGEGVVLAVNARSAYAHEARPGLYSVLSLPGFGESQRRFWWRVFRWVRLPGGRWLLALLARRSRA